MLYALWIIIYAISYNCLCLVPYVLAFLSKESKTIMWWWKLGTILQGVSVASWLFLLSDPIYPYIDPYRKDTVGIQLGMVLSVVLFFTFYKILKKRAEKKNEI